MFLKVETMKNKPFAAIALVTIFVLVVIVTVLTYSSSSAPEFLAPIVRYHFELMIFLAFIGMFVGAATYYLMTEQVEKKENSNKKNVEIILKFLSHDERKVLTKLLNQNGRAMQYELSRLEGFTRLKAHRVVSKLEGEGIIKVEKIGKVNSIRLVEEVMEALSS